MKKILVINDEKLLQDVLRQYLGENGFVAIQALTCEDGERLFMENPDVSAILLDGDMTGAHTLDTLPLLKKYKDALFKGPIIAMSSLFCEELVAAGCTDKWMITDDIGSLLTILNRTK